MKNETYQISEAERLTGEKAHVLRYWEEELGLTIGRNAMGHRFYTAEDIQIFLSIKELKKKGLHLKAIRNLLPKLQQAVGQAVQESIPEEAVEILPAKMTAEANARTVEEEPEIEGLLILLNTVGGDVEAGLALAELVAGMRKPTVSLVLGGGHSIGVPLAVAAKKSFIAPSATMTIHPVRMNGLMLGVPQTLDYFQRMQDRITRFVTHNSHISPERFTRLSMNTQELVLDVGTVLEGEDAVECGLIDSLGSLSDALEALYDMIEKDAGEAGKAKKSGKKKKSK